MITTYLNGKTCIGRVYDRFPVNHHGWEVRAAYWISQGLKKMNIPLTLEPTTTHETLVEYKCKIPEKTAYIRGISWNGYRISRLGTRINADAVQDLPILYDSTYWYNIDVNGYLISNLEEGEITIYTYKYIEDFDAETNAYYPRVPDNEEVLEALDWYILLRMIQKGHEVKGFSLTANNEYINPGIAFDKAIKRARNSANSMDGETREIISRLNRSLILDYNNYTQGEYNPNYYEA